MFLLIMFVLVLLSSFVVAYYVLKPTRAQAAVEDFIIDMESTRSARNGAANILKEDRLSPLPWLDVYLRLLPGTPALVRLVAQAGKSWQVGTVLACSLGMALLGAWLVSVFLPRAELWALLGLGLAGAPIVLLYLLRQARFKKFERLLPEAIDLMTRGLKAGHAVSAVLEMVGDESAEPVAGEFRALHKAQILGLPLREAMLAMVERVPLDDVRFLATAILLQRETGGNLVQILEKTAWVVKERARLLGQLRIYTAQGRLTGWILGGAPFALFSLLMLLNPKYESLLLQGPLGLHMIYAGLGLMVLGVLVIRKIIAIKV